MVLDGTHDESMISERDVRTIVRLLGEVSGQTTDIPSRKRLLMSRLSEMVGADRWIWAVSRYDPDGGQPMCISFLQSGFSERDVGLIMEATQDPDCPAPDTAAWVREISRGDHITRVRRDMIDDQSWYGSSNYMLYQKTVGIDDYLCSVYPMGEGMYSTVGFHRMAGRSGFTPVQRRLTHIVVSEVPWLHWAGVPEDPGESVPGLTPRLRTVFGLLLEGWSRKQIADHLGLSIHTVAEYTKSVYRHFGVNGQVALISRFRVGNGGDAPPREHPLEVRTPGTSPEAAAQA